MFSQSLPRSAFHLVLWLTFPLAIAHARGAVADNVDSVLSVSVLGQPAIKLSIRDLESLPRTDIGMTDEAGRRVTYTGPLVAEILQRAGLTLGKTLRGKRLAEYLLVGASDGYQVIFALPELDSLFRDRKVTLAYQKDGKPLPESEGPLRVVHPEEKRLARWIRHVISFTVRSAADERSP
jgi:DMSO/TMAO reductase YedYZ molybdopterin-dependent catalytic subunit